MKNYLWLMWITALVAMLTLAIYVKRETIADDFRHLVKGPGYDCGRHNQVHESAH